jgi:hypothetical protein
MPRKKAPKKRAKDVIIVKIFPPEVVPLLKKKLLKKRGLTF